MLIELADALARLVATPDTVHQRVRLGLLATLAHDGRSDFQALARAGHVTDGNLSRHLSVLQDAGLVVIGKGYVGRRPRTWAEITGAGRDELRRELDMVRCLLSVVDHVPLEEVTAPVG